jgi:two-component system osmolarity sensor histidine kinase EnvZ
MQDLSEKIITNTKKRKLKKLVPRSLYGRFLLIITIPALLVQIVSIYVFYYTHLDVVSKHMARSVITEISFIKNSVINFGYQQLPKDFAKEVGLDFSFEEKRKLKKKSKIADSNWKKSRFYNYINPLIDPYNQFKIELKNYGLTPFEIYKNPDDDSLIIIKIQAQQGVISFDVPTKRITSSSSYVFTLWMVLTSIITSLISIIFLKNQIRSIGNLTEVAEKFGRGEDVKNFRPSGSKEIRSLAISFIKMRERISRQISQRTDMLSAVSHDLRTPLTRMKLQLAMIENKFEIEGLKSDIDDMERLITEYLEFAKSDNKEKRSQVKIKDFLEESIVSYYKSMNCDIEAKIDLDNNLEIFIKKFAFKRALNNLIDNAFKYGNKALLGASISNNNLIITLDDNGPGIAIEERSNVFKPFYRIDNSRNLDKNDQNSFSGGSGLGLSIVADAVISHGGNIKLLDSKPLGGLCVLISIPFTK